LSDIKIIKYKYQVGDLIVFKRYNRLAPRRREIIALIVKRNVLSSYWYEEAERKVYHSGHDFLVYDVVCDDGQRTSVKENDILKVISTKED
jgi:hypothetical protein